MSRMEEYKKFHHDLVHDPASLARLQARLNTDTFFVEALCIAQEKGYAFTDAEIREAATVDAGECPALGGTAMGDAAMPDHHGGAAAAVRQFVGKMFTDLTR